MSDRDDPKDDLIQGLGLLWRAARKTATSLRKDLDRTNVGRAIDDAGREFVRAATHVVGRVGDELKKRQGGAHDWEPGPEARTDAEGDADAEHPPDGGAPLWERQRPVAGAEAGEPGEPGEPGSERATRPGDGGFRIALDDEPRRGDAPERGGDPERGDDEPERGGGGERG